MKKMFHLLAAFALILGFSTQASANCIDLGRTLRYGSRDTGSGEVTALQFVLFNAGYLKVNPTGYFGPLTMKATKDFQAANNLDADGIVGPITRETIKKTTCVIVDLPTSPVLEQVQETPSLNPVTTSPVDGNVQPENNNSEAVDSTEDTILSAGMVSSLRVRTDGVTAISSDSITVGGTITAGARASTQRWFELTTNPEVYNLSETTISPRVYERSNNQRFGHVFSDLLLGTTYYFRACASNDDLTQRTCGSTTSIKTGN